METYLPLPSPLELLQILGVESSTGLEVGVCELRLHSGDGIDIVLTFDSFGGSTTVRAHRNDRRFYDMYREGSARILLARTSPEIVVEFATGVTGGRFELSLWPVFSVAETNLWV